MKCFKSIFSNVIYFVSIIFNSVQVYAQSVSIDDLWNTSINTTDQALEDHNLALYIEGIKQMERVFKKYNNGDWCYEIGLRYYSRIPITDSEGKYHLTSIDEKKGIEWFEKGAKLGNLKSALVLYRKYRPKEAPYSTLGPKKEWNEYFKARDKSWKYAGIALQASIPADFSDYITLGDAAWFTNNENLAQQYFAKAADNGEYGAIDYVIRYHALEYLTSPNAMYDAGIQMWRREKDNDLYDHHDKENGIIMFEKSAKLNYPAAQKQMGYIYLTGQTVEPDTLKAISWYKLAAKHNLPDVICLLGKLYFNGKGIERDGDKAFEYFKESSDLGYIHSELPLGYCYLYGIGTVKDMNKAREYFQIYFNRLNHTPELRLYYSSEFIIDLDYLIGLTYYFEDSPEAIKLFEASLKNNTYLHSQRADLLYKLSSCYREGKCGVKIDHLKCNNLLNEASKFGKGELNAHNIYL